MTLNLTVEEVNILLGLLGDTPAKQGLYPLLIKIKQQGDAALANEQQTSNPEPI